MHDEERDFLGLINAAMAAPLRGWNCSFLAGRAISQPLPWDYMQLAPLAVRRARRVLDVDTGGGEVLAAIAPPAGSIAVEPHPPNLALVAATLSPHHVVVRPRVGARCQR